jgi:hypothetical protein
MRAGNHHGVDQDPGFGFHNDRVLMQQRFAFGAVGDQGVCLGSKFNVGGKSATAGAYYTGLPYLGGQRHIVTAR